MTQQFLKGLLMALVAVAVSFFSQSPVDYLMMGLTAVCAVLTYTGKNLITVLQSNSPAGSLSLVNIISALLIALGTGILQYAALIIVDGAVDWAVLGKVVLSITFTYLGTTAFSPPNSKTKNRIFV